VLLRSVTMIIMKSPQGLGDARQAADRSRSLIPGPPPQATPLLASGISVCIALHSKELRDMDHHVADEVEHEETLAALVGLMNQLRADFAERQKEWEALGAELEAKGRSLRLVEATVELLQRQHVREHAGEHAMHAAEDEDESPEAQARAEYQNLPLQVGCKSCPLLCTGSFWLCGRRQASATSSTARS
jgi:hypothetical protein